MFFGICVLEVADVLASPVRYYVSACTEQSRCVQIQPNPTSPQLATTLNCSPTPGIIIDIAKQKCRSMYNSRSSIEDWLWQPTAHATSHANRNRGRKRRRESEERQEPVFEADRHDIDSDSDSDSDSDVKLPSPPPTLGAIFPGPPQMQHANRVTPVRSGKRRKEEHHVVGAGAGTGTGDGEPESDGDGEGDGDPTPRRRNPQSSTSATRNSESTGSQTSSVKRRRKAWGLALVSVGAPQLAYFDSPKDKPPPLLHHLATQLEDMDDNKHFVWPELQVRCFLLSLGHTRQSRLRFAYHVHLTG